MLAKHAKRHKNQGYCTARNHGDNHGRCQGVRHGEYPGQQQAQTIGKRTKRRRGKTTTAAHLAFACGKEAVILIIKQTIPPKEDGMTDMQTWLGWLATSRTVQDARCNGRGPCTPTQAKAVTGRGPEPDGPPGWLAPGRFPAPPALHLYCTSDQRRNSVDGVF